MHTARPPRQRGVSLVEALIALAIMSFGLLALVGVQATMRMNSDLSKQRGEATRIATEEIEALRNFTTVPTTAGEAAYDDIATRTVVAYQPPGGIGNTTYRIDRTVTLVAGTQQKVVSVQVSWDDRTGTRQTVTMDSVISGVDPTLSGVLLAPARPSPGNQRGGRHPTIPPQAVSLPGGISAFKPFDVGTVAWVFDNLTGDVRSVCTGVTAAQALLQNADLVNCQTVDALLLAGEVNFNFRLYTADLDTATAVLKPVAGSSTALKIDRTTEQIVERCDVPAATPVGSLVLGDLTNCVAVTPPRPVDPYQQQCNPLPCVDDPALPLGAPDAEAPHWPALNLALVRGSTGNGAVDVAQYNQTAAPDCVTDAPASLGESLARAQRTVHYYCLVHQGSGGWGGRFDLQPLAFSDVDGGTVPWPIDSTGLKVCRYTHASADYTVNRDHPAAYCMERAGTATLLAPCSGQRVRTSLVGQNFLVIGGHLSCPADVAIDPAAGDLINSNTRQHQP